MTTSIAQRIPVDNDFFTAHQQRMILDMYLSGATPQEASVLMEVARLRRLNPLLGQIHFVKRWDATKAREVWACQVAIDGFRAIAQRTGEYNGQDEPEFEHEAGKLILARVKIYRRGIDRPFVGVARYAEFVQTKREGGPVHMWAKMPANQTAKCAEAQGFRKAFPEECSELLAPEEITRVEESGFLGDLRSAGPDNDNAQPNPIATYQPKLAAAKTENALRKVAAEIAKAHLTQPERSTLLDSFNARLCELRSTPPAVSTEGTLPLPEPGTEG